jgi:hypothetical protein
MGIGGKSLAPTARKNPTAEDSQLGAFSAFLAKKVSPETLFRLEKRRKALPVG